MKHLIICAADFVYQRGCNGCSYELDMISFIAKHIESLLLFTHQINYHEIQQFKPDIAYLFDCDHLRPHFHHILHFLKSLHIPIVLLSEDFFYFNMITQEPTTNQVDAIVSFISLKAIEAQYRQFYNQSKFIAGIRNIYINTNTFKDYKLPKIYDVCIYGNLTYNHHKLPLNCVDEQYLLSTYGEIPAVANFYPLRYRIATLLLDEKTQQLKKYNIKHIPTEQCWNCSVRNETLSRIINQSYLTLATRTRTDKCMHKYFEISASQSAILGDVPSDFKDIFDPYVIKINQNMTDQEILDTIDRALENKTILLQKTQALGNLVRNQFGDSNTDLPIEFETISKQIQNHYLKKLQKNV